MELWLTCVIGILAAYGLICILKGIYAIIFTTPLRFLASTELFLYADGTDPLTEQLLTAAEQVRKQYFPRLHIVFVETGSTSTTPARILCERHDAEYIE